MSKYFKALCILFSLSFSGMVMSSSNSSSFYFVSDNVCVSKADVSIVGGKAVFKITSNLICGDMPIKLLSLQNEQLLLSNDKSETHIYDQATYDKKGQVKGVGSYFSPDGGRYFYVLGMYDSGFFKESKDGKVESVLDKNMYSLEKVLNISDNSYVFGDSKKLWVTKSTDAEAKLFSEQCSLLGAYKLDSLFCFDRKNRKINVLSLNGNVQKSLDIDDITFPVTYLPELNMLLAVRGRLGNTGLQDYEAILVDPEKGNIVESDTSFLLSISQVAVDKI